MAVSYLPILIMMLAALLVGATILTLSWFIGKRQSTTAKLDPYESGMPLLDDSRKRIQVRFFLVAMLFILFDIEIAFLYPWAVVFRQTLPFALVEMAVFIGVLGIGYVYCWKKGALDWQ